MRVKARALEVPRTTALVVLGLDIALTGTGLVAVCGTTSDYESERRPQVLHRTVLKPKTTGLQRLEEITSGVLEFVTWLRGRALAPEVIVFEGAGFASSQAHSLGMVHGAVKLALYALRDQWRFVMMNVPPNVLKSFAAEAGHAEKNLMLREVWKRWAFDAVNDDENDAFACTMVGLCKYGTGTTKQRKAITGKVEVIYEGRSRELADEAEREQRDRGDAKRAAKRAKRERKRSRDIAPCEGLIG